MNRKEYVVYPDGSIVGVKVALRPQSGNAKGGILNEHVDARGKVSVAMAEFYRDKGFVLLADAYDADPNPDVAHRGLKVYTQWCNAGRQGKVAEFREEWLPTLVKERRALTKKAASEGTFEFPSVGGEGNRPEVNDRKTQDGKTQPQSGGEGK